jgi:hypothetical protein
MGLSDDWAALAPELRLRRAVDRRRAIAYGTTAGAYPHPPAGCVRVADACEWVIRCRWTARAGPVQDGIGDRPTDLIQPRMHALEDLS